MATPQGAFVWYELMTSDADAAQALDMARDVYTRRQEGVSIWVVESKAITASNPDDKGELFDPAADKMLAEFVGIEKARASLKAKYLPKFKKVLPAKKVARFYQIENKIQAALYYELASQIPLVQ